MIPKLDPITWFTVVVGLSALVLAAAIIVGCGRVADALDRRP